MTLKYWNPKAFSWYLQNHLYNIFSKIVFQLLGKRQLLP